MSNIINEYVFKNTQNTYPLLEIKYANKGANPVTVDFEYGIENISKIAIDEMFAYVDDRVLNNVIYHRYIISTYGRIYDRVKGKFLNPVINRPNNGFYKVKLSYYIDWNNIFYKDIYIARAVKLMFDYYPGAEHPELTNIQIIHSDGDHANNRLSNLQYVFPYNPLIQNNVCTSNPDSCLIDNNLTITDPNQPIRIICSMLQAGCSNQEISNKVGVPENVISDIRMGKIYKSFSAEYSIAPHKRKKLDDMIIVKVCEMLEQGYRNIEISNILGVHPKTIAEIKTRRNYTYISSNYKW